MQETRSTVCDVIGYEGAYFSLKSFRFNHKLLAPLLYENGQKAFSFGGGACPQTPTMGSTPGPRWARCIFQFKSFRFNHNFSLFGPFLYENGQKAFSFRGGGLRPLSPTRGSAPGPRWGLGPQTPVIGSRYALAMA